MRIVLTVALIFMGLVVSAQPGPPPPDPGAPVPISGLEWLLMGGAAYGVSRIRKWRGKENI